MSEHPENGLSLSVSVSRKINLGNYESADVFLSVSGVTAQTTEAEVDELLATTGKLAYSKIAAQVNARVGELKS